MDASFPKNGSNRSFVECRDNVVCCRRSPNHCAGIKRHFFPVDARRFHIVIRTMKEPGATLCSGLSTTRKSSTTWSSNGDRLPVLILMSSRPGVVNYGSIVDTDINEVAARADSGCPWVPLEFCGDGVSGISDVTVVGFGQVGASSINDAVAGAASAKQFDGDLTEVRVRGLERNDHQVPVALF